MKKITLLLYLFLTVITLDLNAQVAIGSGSSTGQAVPVEPFYGYTYSQTIYLKSEIEGAGDITELTWDFAGASISNSNDWTIYIGHTTKAEFTGTSDWVDVTTLTQVHSGTVTLNGSNQVVVDITDFAYNNSDNLIIAVDENTSGYNGSGDDFNCFLTGTSRSITYYNDNTNPDPSSPPAIASAIRTSAPNIILGGITTTVSAPSCAENPVPSISATGVLLNNGAVAIAWDAPSSGDAPTSYEVFWGTSSGALTSIGAIAATTVNITNVDFATEYFWSIVPANAGGSATGCAEWSFTTEDAPPPPANDTLAGATPIVPSVAGTGCSTFTFTNSTGGDGTTDSGLDGACNTTSTGLDRFYSWTATSTGLIWNDGASNPGIVIRDASGAEITCAGTFAGNDTVLSGWAINDDLIIQVYDYGTADEEVTFCLEEYTPPPAPSNDDCANATLVDGALPYNNTQDATTATNNAGFISDCALGMNDGVWYTFTPITGGTVDIAITGVTGWDPEIAIFSGSCGTFVCEESADVGGTGSGESMTGVAVVAGTQYFINIGHYNSSSDSSEGPFTIDISTQDTVGLSVEDNVIQGFSLYPNPVNDRLHLTALDNIDELSVYNLLGQEVLRTQPKVLNTQVDMSNLPTGMYVVKVKVGQQLGSYRIVKE